METILLLAAKSFIVAGGALLLLQVMRKRSAADRSWIAHLALIALLLLPVASFALPSLDVQGPVFLVGDGQQVAAPMPAPLPAPPSAEAANAPASAAFPSPPATAAPVPAAAAIDWPFWSYLLPTVVLLLLTLIALARLFVLKSRATVMVEPEWLTALARAQRRMGFKHGTALLTSDELPSPISWGVVRPVILLNSEAAKSHEEAEAIITHELAHVARLDWAKLMVSRIAVALFWFNPFVWLLAREAHHLREEAADDTVLAADIEDTDYARLLVGVARHECRGLLLGAHGVAPGRNSLSRRIKRVLDTAAARAPGGWRWASAAGFFAAGMAVPVAALNLVAPSVASATDGQAPATATNEPYYVGSGPVEAIADTLPEIIADSTSSAAQAAVVAVAVAGADERPRPTTIRSADGSRMVMEDGKTVLRSADGATITVFPQDSSGRQRTVMRSADGSVLEFPDARGVPGLPPPLRQRARRRPTFDHGIDQAIRMKAVGVTPEYVASIRAALPRLRLDADDLVEMKAVGVTPAFVLEIANSGLRHLNKDLLVEARAVGVRGDFIRGLAAAGYPNLSLDQLVELRAVGVTPAYIEKLRRAGYRSVSVDKLVEMKAVGVDPDDLRRKGGG